MNAADTALSQGLTALLETAGDSVTFRGLSVSVVVNRVPFEEQPFRDNPDFSTAATSRIEIPVGSVSPAPKAGEIITEGTTYHRIQRVVLTGLAYLCDCEVTP
jgi:hypothetical protein